MGNTRLRSSYVFLEHQTQWLISEKHEMNKQVSANTTITLPPWIWAICVSPRCAGMASRSDGEEFVNTGWQSYPSDAGSHPLQWIWRFAGERGIQNASFQAKSAGCVCVGSCGWFYHGNSQKRSGVMRRLARGWVRAQGSATDLHEINQHQMLFCVQICSRE